MKANKTSMAALAGISVLAFAGPVLAQSSITGTDGITASPKVRQFLNEQSRNHPKAASADTATMPCPKCTDKVTTKMDSSARGAYKPVLQVVAHECQGCKTDWRINGVGKAKQSVAVHQCSVREAETTTCCATVKTGGAANGTEKEN